MRSTALLFVLALACGGTSANRTTSAGAPADAGVAPADAGDDSGGAGANPAGDAGVPADAGAASPQTSLNLAPGALVSGHVGLTATVPDGTSRVDFSLDGTVIASLTAAPWVYSWNSFATANGAHNLSASALGTAGIVSSGAIAVTLQNHVKNVFLILMENNDWSSIKGSSAAPYINGTLLKLGAHADKYMNVPNLHPSLPNYLWLESGSNQGVADDDVPANHQLSTKQHLVTLLNNAGVTWKSYQEDIPGTNCPLDYVNQYAPKHNPMLYFTDTNGSVNASDPYCIAHVRPYGELAGALEANTVPAYSFITPNLCNDMHDCGVAAGDAWLSREIPKLMASRAYQEGGLILLTWDESAGSNVPIGLVALSPLVKAGYGNTISYTHSSTVRTLQEIFGVTSSWLGGAATATDLSDLFTTFP